MVETSVTVTDIGVGPLPNGTPGATLLITLSNGLAVPVFLAQEQALTLAQQVFNQVNPRFPGGRLPDMTQQP